MIGVGGFLQTQMNGKAQQNIDLDMAHAACCDGGEVRVALT